MLARTAHLRRQSMAAAAPAYDSLTFRGTANQPGIASSTFTIPSAAIGPADANRRVIVAFVPYSSTLPSCTVGGITATQVASNIFIATVPTGTTASIVLASTGANIIGVGVGWWTVNMPSASVWAHGDFQGGPLDNFEIPANGFGLLWCKGDDTSDRTFSIDQSFIVDNEGFNANGFNFAFAHREVVNSFLATVTGSWSVGSSLSAWASFSGLGP